MQHNWQEKKIVKALEAYILDHRPIEACAEKYHVSKAEILFELGTMEDRHPTERGWTWLTPYTGELDDHPEHIDSITDVR
jgi:hypothetical protein